MLALEMKMTMLPLAESWACDDELLPPTPAVVWLMRSVVGAAAALSAIAVPARTKRSLDVRFMGKFSGGCEADRSMSDDNAPVKGASHTSSVI